MPIGVLSSYVSQVRELIEVKEVITPYGRSGSEETLVKAEMRVL